MYRWWCRGRGTPSPDPAGRKAHGQGQRVKRLVAVEKPLFEVFRPEILFVSYWKVGSQKTSLGQSRAVRPSLRSAFPLPDLNACRCSLPDAVVGTCPRSWRRSHRQRAQSLRDDSVAALLRCRWTRPARSSEAPSQDVRRDPLLHQAVTHRLGAPLRKRLIVLLAAAAIGIPFHFKV